jgi:hypothetical protein
MAARVPQPQDGDVLILGTTKSFSVYAVGRVCRNGQLDFQGVAPLKHSCILDTAVAEAKALLTPGRRIYFRNLDTGDWSEIPIETRPPERAGGQRSDSTSA